MLMQRRQKRTLFGFWKKTQFGKMTRNKVRKQGGARKRVFISIETSEGYLINFFKFFRCIKVCSNGKVKCALFYKNVLNRSKTSFF